MWLRSLMTFLAVSFAVGCGEGLDPKLASLRDKALSAEQIGNSQPIPDVRKALKADELKGNSKFVVRARVNAGDFPPFVDGMAAFLPETDGLVAMGYGACSCFPIVIAGETRGVVALLGDAGIFTRAVLAEIDTLLPIAALTFTFHGISER